MMGDLIHKDFVFHYNKSSYPHCAYCVNFNPSGRTRLSTYKGDVKAVIMRHRFGAAETCNEFSGRIFADDIFILLQGRGQF